MYFEKILIANRGEIAVRIIRACRELGIASVAVYSEADRSALHVRMADEAYLLGPAPAAASYLNVDRVIAAAKSSAAQAIHPGYGFLSERAHFAQACRAAGLVFIGPPLEAIELMGSKIAARELAESLGVPVVPGYTGAEQGRERLRSEAERIGFPLLIKASAGGGGKGMRTVRSLADFDAALEGAQREAKAAFGDDAVFLERLIERPRHVEIQVLADQHGNLVHLFERECSIQRRHQKIIEESPSSVLLPDIRMAMGESAVRLAKAANYCNAGTVEFLLDEAGRFYFLEMNTRLQVEHPVTECVTGLDLVHLQVAVAAGEPLPFQQSDLRQRGHAIEARVYAEDPATFLPSTGMLALFVPPQAPGVRNDAGLETGDQVTVHYDPLLSKLIVYAPDRPSAIARLQCALADYTVLGVTTNLPLLQAIARHSAFASGATQTDFLLVNGLTESSFEPQHLPSEVLVAVALADGGMAPGMGNAWDRSPWRLLRHGMQLCYFFNSREHKVTLSQLGDTWQVQVDNSDYQARIIARRFSEMIVELSVAGGISRIECFRMARDAHSWLIAWQGTNYQVERSGGLDIDRLGGRAGKHHGDTGMEAPMPGTVVKVLVQEGQQVAARQPLIVLEAMKMEHIIVAPYNGVVRRVFCTPGALVTKGAPLVDLEE